MDRIETRRLTLRRFEQADLPTVVDALRRRDVARYLSNVPHPYGMSDAQGYVFGQERPGLWAIEHERCLAGSIELSNELGYWIHPAFHGRRLIGEAAEAVLVHWFDGNEMPVRSAYHEDNDRSRRVLERLGFRPCDARMAAPPARGECVRVISMVLDRTDFEGRHAT